MRGGIGGRSREIARDGPIWGVILGHFGDLVIVKSEQEHRRPPTFIIGMCSGE